MHEISDVKILFRQLQTILKRKMETILEDEQNASNKKSEDGTERNIKLSPSQSIETVESDFDVIKSNVRNEETLNSENSTELKFIEDSSAGNKTEPESESETDSKATAKDDTKNMNISFDEDIILPSVRHDTEIEQKQRDRIKRKEMKSRKELEEEEREKMQ